MALTFKTADLLAVIDGITTAKAAEDARYAQDCADARAQHVVDWNNEHIEEIRALRDYLSVQLRRGLPPRHSAVKRMAPGLLVSRDYVQFFVGGGDGGISKLPIGYSRPDELEGMAALLRAHIGDTITAHQLKELGTHPRDLAKLFQAASVAGAAVAS